MDYDSALRLLALQAVQKPDMPAHTRYIHRWYSKTFHTPLHVVAELDPQDVFVAYYEATYEDMTEDERESAIAELLKTPEELRADKLAKDHERADIFEFAKITEAEERKKEEKKLADLDTKQKQPFANSRMVPEASLPKAKSPMEKLQPDIEMKFVSAEDFEKELEGFGSMAPGRKPQSSS